MDEKPVVRVVVADDHPLMVEAVRDRLGASDEIAVVGTATSADDLLRLVRTAKPDVAVIDNRMPGKSGTDCAREIAETTPATRVIILSAFSDEALVIDALEAGASGYLDKSITGPELIRRVVEVGRGGFGFDPTATARMVVALRARAVARQPKKPLSERELDVLRLVANGRTNTQIAAELLVSSQTVKTYVDRIFSKLGVNDRTLAVREAIRGGLID